MEAPEKDKVLGCFYLTKGTKWFGLLSDSIILVYRFVKEKAREAEGIVGNDMKPPEEGWKMKSCR